jgi:hypothetical protein
VSPAFDVPVKNQSAALHFRRIFLNRMLVRQAVFRAIEYVCLAA